MKVAYLINQYPMVSHSFIRREIQALEQLGVAVERFSIRPVPLETLVDPGDREEHSKTTAILSCVHRIPLAMVRCVLFAPRKLIRCIGVTLALARKSRQGLLRHSAYLAEACLLRQLLHQGGVNHVHAHFGTNSATVVLLCRLLGGPSYSFTVHGPEEFDDPVGLGLNIKIHHCRFVVAISHFGRGQLMRWCDHELWPRIQIVRCTVDGGFLRAVVDPPPESPVLVCVGRLCAQKGQLLLLEALHGLVSEGVDFYLVCAGDGEMRQVMERKITDYGLTERVRITGWLSGEEVRRAILDSRCLVLPSFAEGLPVVIMEAFALARPVVSTYVAGIPELVESQKNGWLLPCGSVQALQAALRDVLAAPLERLQVMGAAGREAVRDRHDALVEGKKLLTLFRGEQIL